MKTIDSNSDDSGLPLNDLSAPLDSLIGRIEGITKKANLLALGQPPTHECKWVHR
jgi:hypothetical protein